MFSRLKDAIACGMLKWSMHSKSSLDTGLLSDGSAEVELTEFWRLAYTDTENPSPPRLLNEECLKVDKIADLDLFFERVYSYYCEKGLQCIIIKWIVELLGLGFTICFSGFFLLLLDWHGLRNAKCGISAVESGIGPCDLAKEAIHHHPLVPFTFSKAIIVGYLVIFTLYWLFCFLRFFAQLKGILEIREFYYNCLNITDQQVKTAHWSAILETIVQVQHSSQLLIRDISEHKVVMRTMRKENYLIGMVNKGVLAFPVSWWIPGVGPAVSSGASTGKQHYLMLTQTLEWAIRWCILQSMFDRNYYVRMDFISNSFSLRKRLKVVGIGMLLLSPFLVVFMLVNFFLRHAEQFYNHPSTASSRKWSNLSRWFFREFNEVDHLFKHRITNSVVLASGYLKQFPSTIMSLIAKFVSFVCGGFAAILIIIAFMEESLLEGHIFGRNLLWYAAVFGTMTAISRAVVGDDVHVIDPEGAMLLVVEHTHYMPKRWRGKENTDSVKMEFENLYRYTGMKLFEDMASIFVTPYLLLFVIPEHLDKILQFLSDFTVDVDGVGHVCSFSTFNFKSHGNRKYGSPYDATPDRRSSQGKTEKSFLSFQRTYPNWEPDNQGKKFLSTLHSFREQHNHQPTQHAYCPFQPCNLSSSQSDQDEMTHGFPQRNMSYYDG